MSNKGNKKLHLHMHKTYHKEKTKKLYKHSKLNLSIKNYICRSEIQSNLQLNFM